MTDSFYVSRALAGHYEAGNLFDLAWTIASALVAVAATAPGRPAPDEEDDRLTLTQELVPYLPVLVAAAVGISLPVSLSDTPFGSGTGFILLGLVAVRQVGIVSQKIRLATGVGSNGSRSGRPSSTSAAAA